MNLKLPQRKKELQKNIKRTVDEEQYDEDSKQRKRPQAHSSYVTLLSDIIDVEPSSYEEVAKKKGKESTSSRRMMSRMQYRDLKGSPQYLPYGSTRSSMKQMSTSWGTRKYSQHEDSHRKKAQTTKRHLQRLEIHMTGRIMCANERRPCMSSKDTHGITHT